MRILTVTNPFGGHELGAVLDDPRAVAEVLASEHAGHVVASERPDAPEAPRRKPSSQE